MIPSKIRVGLVLLALAACRDEAPPMAKVSEVMPHLPLPPQASVVSRDGSPDALKLTLRSGARVADVQAYYRDLLNKNGWKVVNESRDPEGATVLLADRGGPPLWVRIQSTPDSTATMVELAGAVPSRSKTPKPAS